MRISVVICTWNRADELRTTLDSLTQLVIPPGCTWELIVVNNGCTDETNAVIAEFEARLPIRSLFEGELGLSRARNRGSAAARGDLILFTDDDVSVEASWLEAYVDAGERWPDASYFGGVIQPRFERSPPRWVEEQRSALVRMLATRDFGPIARPFAAGEFPFGPNMAVRADAFQIASFDERRGRRGNEQRRGSETSLLAKLADEGLQGVWVPEARVWHRVPVCRMTLRYFWRHYRGEGMDHFRYGRPLPDRALWRFLQLTSLALLWLGLGRTDWVQPMQRAANLGGQMREQRSTRT